MLPVVGAIAVWFSWHLLLDLRSLKPWKMIFYDLLGPFSQGYVWYWGHSPNIKFITNILGGLDQKLGKWSKNDISPCPALKKVANKFREVSYISNHFQSCPRINRSSSLACFFTVSYLLHTAPHPNKHITPFCCPLKYGESVNLIKNLHPEPAHLRRRVGILLCAKHRCRAPTLTKKTAATKMEVPTCSDMQPWHVEDRNIDVLFISSHWAWLWLWYKKDDQIWLQYSQYSNLVQRYIPSQAYTTHITISHFQQYHIPFLIVFHSIPFAYPVIDDFHKQCQGRCVPLCFGRGDVLHKLGWPTSHWNPSRLWMIMAPSLLVYYHLLSWKQCWKFVRHTTNKNQMEYVFLILPPLVWWM